jgi:hypothetical protein
MKKIILVVSITLLIFNSCDSPTEFIDNTVPGRRDYVWTVDTLDVTDNFYYNLWGSSPTDVWTVSASNWEKSIFHFDGNKWSSNQVTGLFNITALYGFAADNIFVGADNGSVWRFDGNSWKLFAKLHKEGTDYFLFQNIWGESPNDFYAFGSGPDENGLFNNSIIAHYLDGVWNMLNTDVLKGNVAHLYKNSSDNKIYFRLTKVGGIQHIDSTIIYEYTGTKYYKLYSSIETKGLQADISLIDNEVYFILRNRIATRRNNQFQTILNIDNPNFYQRIWGRNSKDIFLLMTDGLAHYNGTDFEYLFYFNVTPQTQIYGTALFPKDTFFLVDEFRTRKRLVYHGKLD